MTNRTPRASAATEQRRALQALCATRLRDHNLLIASNRGPVEFYEQSGELRFRRGQGGLVTAVTSMAEETPTTWVASVMSAADARVAAEHDGRMHVPVHGHPIQVSFVAPSPQQYHQYYDQIANAVLWFVQHNITNAPAHPTFDALLWNAWEQGYVEVNRLFAERLIEEARRDGRRPIFMIHDYHLYLVPGLLRAACPDALIQHFTHISWPSPDAWRQLPPAMRERLLESLLGCDVVGFHSPRYAQNFLHTCRELLGLTVDLEAGTVAFGDRLVRVRDYPISVDPDTLRDFATSDEVLEAERVLLESGQPRMVLQVARTDPSKNILRSLYAFEHLLERYPEYLGTVQFLGLYPSSRQTTELYKEYLQELCQVAERINETVGTHGWQPIVLHFENDYTRAIAAMRNYELLVVNSIADGMNLVAKEGPIVNRRGGVLVLSEGAGAVEELGSAALVVNPFDLVGMAEAFHTGLCMSPLERQQALVRQREAIAANTIFRWAHDQLADLLPARPGAVTMFAESTEVPQT